MLRYYAAMRASHSLQFMCMHILRQHLFSMFYFFYFSSDSRKSQHGAETAKSNHPSETVPLRKTELQQKRSHLTVTHGKLFNIVSHLFASEDSLMRDGQDTRSKLDAVRNVFFLFFLIE